ncbi:hypothetical protein [Roseiterribacter gracilis]|uniref:hypothetical protein n=1 Tax=Roseiterribacter gracilis TaxID=2812848 RepID=UPI003B436808
MTDAFVIETATAVAGIAVRQRRGFRFFVSDNRFATLEQRVFSSTQAARRAAELIERAQRRSTAR